MKHIFVKTRNVGALLAAPFVALTVTFAFAFAQTACGPARSAPPLSFAPHPADPQSELLQTSTHQNSPRTEVLTHARRLLTQKKFIVAESEFSRDPIGFVRAAFWGVKIELFDAEVAESGSANGMTILYESQKKHGRLHQEQPRPGDLLFLDSSPNSTNADQKTPPVQVAIVERVAQDGTISALGYFSEGPMRIYMNLRHPNQQKNSKGKINNSRLKGSESTLAAALFRAFANPFTK